jgi:Peptidase family M1 domain
MRRGWLIGVLLAGGTAAPARALEPPPDLPRYDLAVRIDPGRHTVQVRERVTWTNPRERPAHELVFNVYPRYQIAEKDTVLLAKTVELLREHPGVALDPLGRAGEVTRVTLAAAPPAGLVRAGGPGRAENRVLATYFQQKIDTALVVALPNPVPRGESVTVELDYTLTLPNKQGRWGYWEDVIFLTHWLPTLAVYDDAGWQPTPFIPWHQPFFLEAGVYRARITLPADQKLACSGPVREARPLAGGWQEVETGPCPLRDFAVFCSSRYQEFTGKAGPVDVKVLARPEHAHYAQEMVKIAQEALPAYGRWFGEYPYRHFTIAEAYFPWNGNEQGALVMIDHRIFEMPHLARGYVDYLVSHEILHQWWYGVVGTNGYAETFMDEAPATYFSHRLLNAKHGKNNAMLEWPTGLGWLPNIHRENYRFYALAGSIRRGDLVPAVQTMDEFGSVVGLFSGAYDRGSKVIGMIEDRLGEAATFDFFRRLYRKYYFRVLRVADFKRELAEYTGRPWDDFFDNWVYGKGVTDWKIEAVDFRPRVNGGGQTVTVTLHQKAQVDERTVLGFAFGGGENYAIRIPVIPQVAALELDEPRARVESLPDHRVRVTVELSEEPTQIAVDPDQVLEDAEPANNYWKARERWRWTPLYTQLEETDLMNDYDRWNFIVGPWVYASATRDPWFQRSNYAGLRAGAYRTQQFAGGAYLAVRSDYRDLVVGADGLVDHFPLPKTQVGYTVEQRVAGPFGTEGRDGSFRAVVYGRYIFLYGASLYLPPMHYAELFGTYQENPLPFARTFSPGAVRPESLAAAGLHWHLDLLTPYWDPERGYRLDATYSGGGVDLAGTTKGLHKFEAQATAVEGAPDEWPWLAGVKLAGRVSVAAGLPDEAQLFALGGSTLFRGFDLAERQGSLLWVVNVELRVPLVRRMCWDVADHVMGLRGLYLAPFYDVGAVYVSGRSVGDVAHALGVGLRADVAWFSFIERTMLRLDVAKTVNSSAPVQVWVGVSHAF